MLYKLKSFERLIDERDLEYTNRTMKAISKIPNIIQALYDHLGVEDDDVEIRDIQFRGKMGVIMIAASSVLSPLAERFGSTYITIAVSKHLICNDDAEGVLQELKTAETNKNKREQVVLTEIDEDQDTASKIDQLFEQQINNMEQMSIGNKKNKKRQIH